MSFARNVSTALLALSLAACGRSGSPEAMRARANADVAAPSNAARASDGVGGSPAEPGTAEAPQQTPMPTQASTTMVIRTGTARVKVDSLEIGVARVRALATRVGGFIANSSMQGGEDQAREATLEIKIPAARFDEALAGLTPLGKVESQSVNAEEVGEEFVDVTARMQNAHRLEDRLVDLLAHRTGKLEDVLQVERELARVREEIERYQGRLRYLSSRVATSTLTVTVHEPEAVVGPTGGSGVLGESVRQAWRNFVQFIAAAIALSGVLIPLLILIGAIVLVGRRLRRRSVQREVAVPAGDDLGR